MSSAAVLAAALVVAVASAGRAPVQAPPPTFHETVGCVRPHLDEVNFWKPSVEQSEPSLVTAHAIALAGEIHSYLKDHHVLGAEPAVRDARLLLVDAARQLLTTGLALLGIPAPERM